MDRHAAGALLALAVCIASSDAAPAASNQTSLDLYDGAAEGCYYNFQHYGEGDRIMTNEPCLNCTCHNRMLMCYLRVCPFTKPIGQDCTVEKRADQCCPIVTCPDVPVDLLTSTSTTSPAEYGATGVGKLDKYGCSINGKYFSEGAKVPPTPNKPCEHCYCIRNMTTCVMQECTLHVDGCTPIYNKDVCCPVRYSCDHPEDEVLLLDDMTTTVRPTPGFLLTTTTLSPVTQMSQDCVHEERIVADGALIKTEKACEHCYCMKGDIVCVVQECGTPMENEGKNCASQAPKEGQCCPDTYICVGDEVATDLPSDYTTQLFVSDEITTLSPPRRVGVEGSGYRKETEESYTEMSPFETDAEGSGYDHGTESGTDIGTSEKYTPEIISETTEDILYVTSTARTPTLEEIEKTTEPDKGLNTVPSGQFDEDASEPSIPQKTTTSEEIKLTESPELHGNKDDQTDDRTILPEVTLTPMLTDKLDESSITTETVFKQDDEIDKVTEHDKTSTPAYDITEKTTSAQPVSSESEAPTDDENEVKLTTAEYVSSTDQTIAEKETTTESIVENATLVGHTKPTDEISTSEVIKDHKETTESFLEVVTSAEVTKSSDKESVDETIKDTETTSEFSLEAPTSTEVTKLLDEVSKGETMDEKDSTTESILELSSTSESIKPSQDVSDEDTLVEKEVTTESLLETFTSSSKLPDEISGTEIIKEATTATLSDVSTSAKPLDEESVDETIKEKDSTTQSVLEKSTSTEASKPSEEEVTKEKESTSVSPLETSTSANAVKPSKEESTEEVLKDKESTTELSSEISTSGDAYKPLDEINTEQVTKEKDSTTESLLEASTSAESVKPLDEVSNEEVTKEKESTTEFLLEAFTSTKAQPSGEISGEEAVTEKEPITEVLLETTTVGATKPTDEISSEEVVREKEVTTESLLDTTISVEATKPLQEVSAVSVTSSPDDTIPTTDKASIPETTSIDNQENEVEDFARIPGEGDCLLNSITYQNNSEVPSTNNCHTSCRCISSIIKCDPIICSPPPEYMDNCQPTYDSPDSCCPTYICHTGETMPPQPDSHMSGTEKPVTSSTIECNDDQCKVKQDVESSAPSDRPEIGDVDEEHKEILPTDKIHGDCGESECPPATDLCTSSDCQAAAPVQPCVGEKCDIEPVITPVKDIPLCQNKEDCEPQAVPCEGDSCILPPTTDLCANGDCEAAIPEQTCVGDKCNIEPVITPVKDIPLCENKDDCQPQAAPCVGDSCKHLPATEDCANGDCQTAVPVQPCVGDKCDIEPGITPVKDIPLCQNKEDCEPQAVPCEGDSCIRPPASDLCTNGDCQTAVLVQPCVGDKCDIEPGITPVKDIPLCQNKEDCEPQAVPCEGDSCIRPPASDLCTNGDCQAAVPEQPCVGDKCDIEPVITPVKEIPLCDNKDDCLPQVAPCEGDSCIHVGCSTGDCDGGAISPPITKDKKPEVCTDSNDCQKQGEEETKPCLGDACRRQDNAELENQLPIDCSGSECDKQKPYVVSSGEKIDITTETPIKDILKEPVTETMLTQDETSSQYPEQFEGSTDVKTPSQTEQSPEQSTPKQDISNELFTPDTTSEIIQSSEFTTRASPITESFDEKLTDTEPYLQSEDVSTVSVLATVTQGTPQKDTTKTGEELDIKMDVTVSTEKTELGEEQSSGKPTELPVTDSEEKVTDETETTTKLPEITETKTKIPEPPSTEIKETTTASSSDLPTESHEEPIATLSPNMNTELPSVITEIPQQTPTDTNDKDITDLPKQHETDVTIGTEANQIIQEVTTIMPEKEKDIITVTPQPSDESSNAAGTQTTETDAQKGTITTTQSPLGQDTSVLPDKVGVTVTETAQKITTDITEPNEIEKTTSKQETPKVTELENVITTESGKQEISTGKVDATTESQMDFSSTEAFKQEQNETEGKPFTNAPVTELTEDKTKISETSTTGKLNDDNVTLQPDTYMTKKPEEAESPQSIVTVSQQTSTTSPEVTFQYEEGKVTKTVTSITEKAITDTDAFVTEKGDNIGTTTDSSLIEQDKLQKEHSTTQASETFGDSSTIHATLLDTEGTTSKPVEESQFTSKPTKISDINEIKEQEEHTTDILPVSDIVTPTEDDILTKSPVSEDTKPEITVTEGYATELIMETTESQRATVSEDDSQITTSDQKEISTDKQAITNLEDSPVTQKLPSESSLTDSVTTSAVPLYTQENVSTAMNEITSQATYTDLAEEKTEKIPTKTDLGEGEPTESPIRSHSESESLTTKAPEGDLITLLPGVAITEVHDTFSTETPVEYPVTDQTVIDDDRLSSTVDDIVEITEKPDKFTNKDEIRTPAPEIVPTDSDSDSDITKSQDDIPGIGDEELTTSMPAVVTEQNRESQTTEASELGPKIKDQDTKEPDQTTRLPSMISSEEGTSTKAHITIPSEISTTPIAPVVTEADVSFATNIPESHIKGDETEVTKISGTIDTISSDATSSPQEEPTQAPHETISELQTDELLEVTQKPTQPFTEEPYAISTGSNLDTTQPKDEVIATKKPLETTTEDLTEDKTTERPLEISTDIPHSFVTEESHEIPTVSSNLPETPSDLQTEIDTNLKESTTEALDKQPVTKTEKEATTTEKSDQAVTEGSQDVITKATFDEALTEIDTKSPIESQTSVTEVTNAIVTKEPGLLDLTVPQEASTETSQDFDTEKQQTVTTKIPEMVESEKTTPETLQEVSTVTADEDVTMHEVDTETSTKAVEASTETLEKEITKSTILSEQTSEPKYEVSETTPFVVELEEHTHKTIEEISTILPADEESTTKLFVSNEDASTEKHPEIIEQQKEDQPTVSTSLPSDDLSKLTTSLPIDELVLQSTTRTPETSEEKQDEITSPPTQQQDNIEPSSDSVTTISDVEIPVQMEKTPSTEKPFETDISQATSVTEEEILPVTSKATTVKIEEEISTSSPVLKPEEKPVETPKPGLNEVQPTDEIPDDESLPSGGPSGYGQESDYVEEDQAFGPGTCRYGGKVYVSAQQIPRDDPCDFCFCFRSDIICLQQSCPPPIHGCHEEPIQGFCCPRYECPVAMATSLNVTTTTTTTTTTLPPHFLPHAYKGAAQRRGCQIKGHTYKVGEVVRASSGPCLHCTCGGDGQMKCDPKACTPEPMLRQMIAAAVSAKRRR